MRDIFLPELLSISIKNYTLYPNGLDFKYDFIKGFNLVVGGNGMGKTTFVSLIKYALIGNYKKQYEYTRTYKENKIEKRERHSDDFFKNRMDNSIDVQSEAFVTISFKINETNFTVIRNLEKIQIEHLYINGVEVLGEKIEEHKYENLKNKSTKKSEMANFLPFIFEEKFEESSKISFDDLIFFVNYILFFGEDHKTVLWDEDVQKELFNTFFNSPELNTKRQEAEREAKYFDSLSRHKSEDKRAINKVLEKIQKKNDLEKVEDALHEILKLKERLERINFETLKTHRVRNENTSKISILESSKNTTAQNLDSVESKRNLLLHKLSHTEYRHQHPRYESFLKNIQTNHICPLCNSKNEVLYQRTIQNLNSCWVCETSIVNEENINSENRELLNTLNDEFQKNSVKLKNIQNEIKSIQKDNVNLDSKFRQLDSEKNNIQVNLRNLEFEHNQNENISELQPFYDEINKLTLEQEEFSKKSETNRKEAQQISKLIETTVLKSVQKFSNLFSLYAGKFLMVDCQLTYEKIGNDDLKKFYPKINGTIRKTEFELSESQRFFIDHSFRMSILSHFYTTPTFYIVETPDSSLDLSYEKNAADVFTSFLVKPYSLILTSNLNNSSFVNYLLDNKNTELKIVPLFEIAKKSVIQEENEILNQLYNSIKNG